MKQALSITASAEKTSILLTFDVEDWFQVENFRPHMPHSRWPRCELRVEKNIHRVLDLLDNTGVAPKATFFILGWLARRLPGMVREIAARGHEVASHGHDHELMDTISKERLFQDLTTSKHLLEEILGQPVKGYRAPSFSIFDSALELVRKAGYHYDSSYNSFGGNQRYGRLDLTRFEDIQGIYGCGNDFFEVPVSNLKLGSRVFPLGGGGYFRLFPFCLFKLGMHQVLKENRTFVFYAHPWEFDPDQPKVSQAPVLKRFRHYVNLDRTAAKLTALVASFPDTRFISISSLIDEVTAP